MQFLCVCCPKLCCECQINNFNSRAPLNTKTLAMDALHHGGVREYDAHNIFGFTEAIATRAALESHYKKRSFVLTRSTFAGSGVRALLRSAAC